MYKGKKKCRILKQIRAEIARNNDIDYVIEECKHKGDCAGTCPKCEAEVRMLEAQLAERARLGKRVALAGVAAGIALTVSACTPETAASSTAASGSTIPSTQSTEKTEQILEGEIAETTPIDQLVDGEIALPGDVALPDPEQLADLIASGDLPALAGVPVRDYEEQNTEKKLSDNEPEAIVSEANRINRLMQMSLMGGPFNISSEMMTKEELAALKEFIWKNEYKTLTGADIDALLEYVENFEG